jgi:hypothetical protein
MNPFCRTTQLRIVFISNNVVRRSPEHTSRKLARRLGAMHHEWGFALDLFRLVFGCAKLEAQRQGAANKFIEVCFARDVLAFQQISAFDLVIRELQGVQFFFGACVASNIRAQVLVWFVVMTDGDIRRYDASVSDSFLKDEDCARDVPCHGDGGG